MPAHELLLSFNAGEFSPLLDSRSDLQKYKSACQLLENFLLLPYGGALRRPGTEYLGQAKYPDRRCRLIGFNFSTTTNFMLEFGHEYIRFWSNGIQVLSGGSILELAVPYQEQDLRAIQLCPINDIIYLTHPNHYTAKLSRLADDNWTWQKVQWTFPPTLDENITDITINPSATTGNITLTASSALFEAGHVGSWWIIGHNRSGEDKSFVQRSLAATGTTAALHVLGSWELTTYGNWDGTLKVQRRETGSAVWESIRTYHNKSVGERNVSATGDEEKECDLRLDFNADAGADTSGPNARLEVGDARFYGAVEITGFTSTTVVNATVKKDLWEATATRLWAEAAFSEVQGFPRSVTLLDARLMLAGTKRKPLSIHGSTIDDFENFRLGSRDDQAILFTLSAKESNPINWQEAQQGKLLIGTAGEEWTMSGQDEALAMGPNNVRATRQSSYGSAHLQARLVNEVIMFVQRQGRKVRELTFAFEKDSWVAPDLTVLANHISESNLPPVPDAIKGIVETAFQQQPDAVLWCITADGRLIGMTYERDQNVVGWHRHSTDGTFETVGSIYGGVDSDEVWFSVQREIDGAPVRYIERMRPDHRDQWVSGNKPGFWYLDCAVRKVFATPTSIITGLGHLEGKEVGVFADGATQPNRTVIGGSITLQAPSENVLVGLPFISTLQPMKIEIPMQDGPSKDRKGRIHQVKLRVHQSLGLQFSNDGEHWRDVYFRNGDTMDASPAIFTGMLTFSTGAPVRNECEIWLRQDKPMPLCILSLTAILDFHGD